MLLTLEFEFILDRVLSLITIKGKSKGIIINIKQ